MIRIYNDDHHCNSLFTAWRGSSSSCLATRACSGQINKIPSKSIWIKFKKCFKTCLHRVDKWGLVRSEACWRMLTITSGCSPSPGSRRWSKPRFKGRRPHALPSGSTLWSRGCRRGPAWQRLVRDSKSVITDCFYTTFSNSNFQQSWTTIEIEKYCQRY